MLIGIYVLRTAIEGLWIEVFHLDSQTIISQEKRRRVLIVTIWFLLSLLTALFIPNITIVIHYLGALAATFMFIFPGMCLLLMILNSDNLIESINSDAIYRRRPKLLLSIAIFYILVGTFIIGLVVTQSLQKDFSSN